MLHIPYMLKLNENLNLNHILFQLLITQFLAKGECYSEGGLTHDVSKEFSM